METSYYPFMIPAILALSIKVAVLFLSKKSNATSLLFITMVLVFAVHNFAEVLGFMEYFRGERYTMMLRWYYVMSICGLAAMLFYSKDVSQVLTNSAPFNVVVTVVTVLLCCLLMFTDSIVAGSTSIGYIMTAVKGEYYWVFQVTALLSYVLIVWMLQKGYRNSESHTIEIQCGYTLFALAPLMFVAIAVLGLMSFGWHINGAGIFPLMTTLFLLITLKSESKHGITDVRRHVPFSLERKSSREIMNIFSAYAKDEKNYRDSMAELEKLMVLHKHEKHNGNVSSTAVSMDIPRSSLYSIFRRLEIEHNEEK